MMRLIDKDGLLELIKDLEVTYQEDLDSFKDEELSNPQRYRDTQRGRIEGVIACSIDVYNAEEVEAIPIEWIKKWAADNSNGEWSIEYRTVFNGILKDWKKENGIEKSTRNI